jgi:3',5'-cyclic AMP phosphodiesterase CpdA
MRTVVHLSDLHFGRVDPALIDPCLQAVRAAKPDLVIVSGDLTQRARPWQFRQAREFLDSLPSPQLVLAGNHDVPLHNIFVRLFRPYARFRRYITDDLDPVFQDDEIAVVGINTARGIAIAGGALGNRQVERACARLEAAGKSRVRLVVTHHPFDLPPTVAEKHLVRGSQPAIAALARSGADIFLAGHLHLCHTELTTRRYTLPDYAGLIVQASTGLSTRTRGEANSFNLLRVSPSFIRVETISWTPPLREFTVVRTDDFDRAGPSWKRVIPGEHRLAG